MTLKKSRVTNSFQFIQFRSYFSKFCSKNFMHTNLNYWKCLYNIYTEEVLLPWLSLWNNWVLWAVSYSRKFLKSGKFYTRLSCTFHWAAQSFRTQAFEKSSVIQFISNFIFQFLIFWILILTKYRIVISNKST